MDDTIFDDVDAILSDDITGDEDKSFNEAELHDIMSEIENLEKEFVTEKKSSMTLQEQIDAEMASAETKPEVKKVEAQIMSFEKPVASTPVFVPVNSPSSSSSEVSFAAHGQMNFNLDFKVGKDTAKLSVDPVKGLMLIVAGVEVCISEDSGCTVSMENGMTFTIPLSAQNKSPKKKSA
jgi:hypothetical protein